MTGDPSNVVDLYNSATGTWSTALLSVAHNGLVATSVGNVALFAGGVSTTGALLRRECGVCVLMGCYHILKTLRSGLSG
jgi:hypothetical protein